MVGIIGVAWGQQLEWGGSIGGIWTLPYGQMHVRTYKNSRYVAGAFDGTIDMDLSAGAYLLTSQGSNDIVIARYDLQGNLLWAFSIGGTGNDWVRDVSIDEQGNVYVVGSCENTVDFDPSTGVYNLTANGGRGGYVAKYDSNGTFQWAFLIDSPAFWEGTAAIDYYQGYIYIIGSIGGQADFDPGAGTYFLTSNGLADPYVAKYDTNANLIWAFSIGSATRDEGLGIYVDSLTQSIYAVGYLGDTIDFDPGSGVYKLAPVSAFDWYIARYDFNGGFKWAFVVGGKGYAEWCNNVRVDRWGNIYVVGVIEDSMDFDPGSGTYWVVPPVQGAAALAMAKYDSNGVLQWAIALGDRNFSAIYGKGGLYVDSAGGVWTINRFGRPLDFDYGSGVYVLDTVGGDDIYIVYYDSSGVFRRGYRIGSTGNDVPGGIWVDEQRQQLCIGGYVADSANIALDGSEVKIPGGFFLGVYRLSAAPNITFMGDGLGGMDFDIGHSLRVDSSGAIYVAGVYRDSIDVLAGQGFYWLYAQDTGYEAFVAKYNNNGSLLWARRMGGGGVIWVSDLEVDKQGRVYVVGGFKDTLDVDSMVFNAIDGVDGYVVVFDTMGMLIESHRLGGNGDEWVEALVLKGSQWQLLGVFTDSVDIGGQWLTAQGLRDFYVVSWDSLRQIQWYVQEGGGTGEVVAKYLTKDKGGRLYVGGYFTGSVAIGGNVLTSAGGKDVFVYSMDSTGQFRWVLSGGGKGDEEGELAALEDEEARIQIVGSCGDSAVFGMDTLYSHGGRDVLWLAVDTSGQWLWARNIGGKGEDWGEAIAVHNGSVYIGGNFSDTVDFALGVMEVRRVSNGGTDMFVGQYRSDGVLSGLLTIGGDSNDVLRGLAIGSDGSLYLTGGYQDTVDFSGGIGSYISVARGLMDYFFARYGPFVESYGLVDTVVCDTFYVSPWGDTLYQSGVYVDTLMNVYGGDSVLTVSLEMVEIDTSVLVVGDTLYAVGGYEVYRWLRCDSGYVVVASGDSVYVPVVSGMYAVEISHRGCVDTSGCRRVLLSVEEGIGGLRVYPNPVGTLLYVDFGGVVGGVRLQLMDGVGRVVWEGVYEGVSRVVVPLRGLPSGMYWLRVVLGGRVGVYKVVRY